MQESLFDAMELDGNSGKKVLEIIEKAVHHYGIKSFAYLIKREPQQIRDALSENGKHFSVAWLPVLLRRDPEFATTFINYLCDIANKNHPEDKEELTPEEKLREYEDIIERHGLQLLFKGQ